MSNEVSCAVPSMLQCQTGFFALRNITLPEHTVYGKHVRSMRGVARAPCLVCKLVDFSCSMVPLIEGYSYQSF